MIRVDDGRAGFGRRRSPAPGHSQTIGQSRKSAPHALNTTRVPGTTINASDLVSTKSKERLELGLQIRELIQAGRPQSIPDSVRATLKKASPREPIPVDKDQAVSAAAVLQSMSSVEEKELARKSGSPGEPGKTFDDLFDWTLDDSGFPY